MPKQIVVIHGGNAFEKYEDYLNYLKNKKLTLEDLSFIGWKDTLGSVLGADYSVMTPQMPNSKNARYLEWKIWFEKLIPLMNDPMILIGHSLGGIFLAKYLSENNFPKKIKATLLVAAPFNTPTDHPLVDFVITEKLDKFSEQGGEIYLFHSKDDQIVPFSNYEEYKKHLPTAKGKIFNDKGHFHQAEFPEIIEEIKSLT